MSLDFLSLRDYGQKELINMRQGTTVLNSSRNTALDIYICGSPRIEIKYYSIVYFEHIT